MQDWGFSPMVEHLPSKYKALGSVLSFRKKKKKLDAAFLWLKVRQMKENFSFLGSYFLYSHAKTSYGKPEKEKPKISTPSSSDFFQNDLLKGH